MRVLTRNPDRQNVKPVPISAKPSCDCLARHAPRRPVVGPSSCFQGPIKPFSFSTRQARAAAVAILCRRHAGLACWSDPLSGRSSSSSSSIELTITECKERPKGGRAEMKQRNAMQRSAGRSRVPIAMHTAERSLRYRKRRCIPLSIPKTYDRRRL